jgi:hypothetical protein
MHAAVRAARFGKRSVNAIDCQNSAGIAGTRRETSGIQRLGNQSIGKKTGGRIIPGRPSKHA